MFPTLNPSSRSNTHNRDIQKQQRCAAIEVINKQITSMSETPEAFIDKIKTHLLKTNEIINQFWFSKIDQITQGFKQNSKIPLNRYIIDQVCESILENWIPKSKETTTMSMATELLEDKIIIILSMTNKFTYGTTCSIELSHKELNSITSTYLYILTKYYETLIVDHNTKLSKDNKDGTNTIPRLSTNTIFSFDPILDSKRIMYPFKDTDLINHTGLRRRPPRDIENSYCNEKAMKLKKITLTVSDKMIVLLHGVSFISQYINSFDDAFRLEKLLNSIYSSYEHLLDLDTKTHLIFTIKELSSLSQAQKLYHSVYDYIDQKDLMDVDSDNYNASERDQRNLPKIKHFQRILINGLAMCCKIDNCKTCNIIEVITFGLNKC